jgi:uncharacterized protein (DUF2141 family)
VPLAAEAQTDDCANASPAALIPDTPLTLTGDNTNATPDGDFLESSQFFGSAAVWHTFVTEECMDVTLSYCGQSEVWETTWGFLFTTCPGDSMPVFPNALDTTTCADENTTYYYYSLQPGTYHLPVLLATDGSATGPYSITLSGQTCSNDVCSFATPLPLDPGGTLVFTGDNTNATSNGDWVFGSMFTDTPVIWHSFTTTACTTIDVSYCGQDPAWTGILAMLFSTCPANENEAVMGINLNDTACADGNYSFRLPIVPAGTYYLPVLLDAAENSIGAYSISITAETCGSVENDHCQLAIPETLLPGDTITFTGNNSTATAEYDWVEGSPNSGMATSWHAFTISDCSVIHVSFCGTTPEWTEATTFLTTDCPASTLITSDLQMNCDGGDNEVFTYLDVQPGTYYIPVVDQAGGTGPYEIMVHGSPCEPQVINEGMHREWVIYPNPAEGMFNLSNGTTKDVMLVELVDLSGRTIISTSERIIPGAVEQIILPKLSAGLYIVRATDTTGDRREAPLMVH